MADATITIKDADGNDKIIGVILNGTEYIFKHTLVTADGSPMEDDTTESMRVVDFDHHEVHDGDAFTASANGTLASGATIVIAFTTPNTTKWIHMVSFCRGSEESNCILREVAVFTAATGTAITPINRNRNSATASALVDMEKDPTVTTPGNIIYQEHLKDGKNLGGGSRGQQEFILKQNTTYAFTITSEAANNDTELILNYYEHTNS